MTVATDDLPSLLKTAEVLQISGLTPESGHNLPSSFFSIPSGKRPYKQSHTIHNPQEQAQTWNSDAPSSSISEGPGQEHEHDKIDPQDFLTADMTCIKEVCVYHLLCLLIKICICNFQRFIIFLFFFI